MTTTHDLVVLGGGAAGLTAAGVAVSLGASVALVEADRLGGDCTWTGCVPSKALLRAAHVAHQSATAARVGLTDTPVAVDFPALMRHVRGVREGIYREADAPPVFEAIGVDVRPGRGRFVDPHTVEVTGASGETTRVSGKRVVVVTGAQPTVPDIPGLAETPYLTSETLFEITEQPRHLAILGGGPIGVEMAQAFRRLGSQVTLIARGGRILEKDDAEPVSLLTDALAREGVAFRFGTEIARAERDGAGVALTLREAGSAGSPAGETRLVADALLVAVGRSPSVDGLGLDAAGVAFSDRGITVDARGRTTVRHIYAAGDVTGQFALTHMSEHTARIAVTNAVLRLPARIDAAHVPWATYTEPELAHVGATVAALDAAGTRYRTFRFPYGKLDRAITDGETTGLVSVHATRGGRILGASVLGARAGDLIGELALAMRTGVSLRALSETVHPYPTYGLGVRRAADQWFVQARTERLVRTLRRVLRLRGPVSGYEPGQIV